MNHWKHFTGYMPTLTIIYSAKEKFPGGEAGYKKKQQVAALGYSIINIRYVSLGPDPSPTSMHL